MIISAQKDYEQALRINSDALTARSNLGLMLYDREGRLRLRYSQGPSRKARKLQKYTFPGQGLDQAASACARRRPRNAEGSLVRGRRGTLCRHCRIHGMPCSWHYGLKVARQLQVRLAKKSTYAIGPAEDGQYKRRNITRGADRTQRPDGKSCSAGRAGE